MKAAPIVALLVHPYKPAAIEAARRLSLFLNKRGVATCAPDDVAMQVNPESCQSCDDVTLGNADFAVVFGGDGTLLGAARQLAPFGTPLLGVHLGHFGFMNETDEETLEEAVTMVLEDRCTTEERLMLQIIVHRQSVDAPLSLLAMNDCAVASRAVRMVHVRVEMSGETLTTYSADGVLVATPTGSTGYSLSAGGPLVHPSAPVLLVTPISPHTLNARTLVVPETETIRLTVEPPTRDTITLAVDGQIDIALQTGDSVTVTKAEHRARFLSVGGPSFYRKIRERWHYGERAL